MTSTRTSTKLADVYSNLGPRYTVDIPKWARTAFFTLYYHYGTNRFVLTRENSVCPRHSKHDGSITPHWFEPSDKKHAIAYMRKHMVADPRS